MLFKPLAAAATHAGLAFYVANSPFVAVILPASRYLYCSTHEPATVCMPCGYAFSTTAAIWPRARVATAFCLAPPENLKKTAAGFFCALPG